MEIKGGTGSLVSAGRNPSVMRTFTSERPSECPFVWCPIGPFKLEQFPVTPFRECSLLMYKPNRISQRACGYWTIRSNAPAPKPKADLNDETRR